MIIRYAQQEPYKKSQVAPHISRLVRGPSRRCTCEGWMRGPPCSSCVALQQRGHASASASNQAAGYATPWACKAVTQHAYAAMSGAERSSTQPLGQLLPLAAAPSSPGGLTSAP